MRKAMRCVNWAAQCTCKEFFRTLCIIGFIEDGVIILSVAPQMTTNIVIQRLKYAVLCFGNIIVC